MSTPVRRIWKLLVCAMAIWSTWTTLCRCTRKFLQQRSGNQCLFGTKLFSGVCTSLLKLSKQHMQMLLCSINQNESRLKHMFKRQLNAAESAANAGMQFISFFSRGPEEADMLLTRASAACLLLSRQVKGMKYVAFAYLVRVATQRFVVTHSHAIYQ